MREQIFSLAVACLLYPAHDCRGVMVRSVDEERRFNPRLGSDTGVDDFAGYMNNLNLPNPKQIDVAVPANLQCGRPAGGSADGADPEWTALKFTFSGISDIEPHALEEVAGRVQLIDVREADEFTGTLGHIRGAKLILLGQLKLRDQSCQQRRWGIEEIL